MKCRVAVLVSGFIVFLCGGLVWSQTEGFTAAITGTVTYRQRIALPSDATVVVSLEDVSRVDAPAINLAVLSIVTRRQHVPIPFELKYDPSQIDPSHRYSLKATISSNGQMLFTTTSSNPVLTQGAPRQLDLMLDQVTGQANQPVAAAPNSPPQSVTLDGTYWKLTQLGGKAALKGIGDTEAYLIFHANEGHIAGSSGCNRVVGSYEMKGESLHIDPAGMTMMACSPSLMKQEQSFSQALRATNTFRIEGQNLELLNGNQTQARFHARYLK